MSLRDRILRADVDFEKVDVAEWDATVEVRPMTLEEFMSLGGDEERIKDEAAFMAKVLIKSLYHEGIPLFEDQDVEHVKNIAGGVLAPLINTAIRVNKLDVTEEDETKN